MTRNARRGQIPDDLGWLVDWLETMQSEITGLTRPDGAQRAGTVPYLASLKKYGGGETLLATGTVANDAVIHWFFPSGLDVGGIYAPTNKLLVEVSCGEASITPGGSHVISYVGFFVFDANGVVIPGSGFRSGQRYTNIREGLGLTTFRQTIVIPDPAVSPPPYRVIGRVGMWVSTLNTTPCSTQFSDMAVVAEVIGDAVAL